MIAVTPRAPRRLLGRAPTPRDALALMDRYTGPARWMFELRPLSRGWLVFAVAPSGRTEFDGEDAS